MQAELNRLRERNRRAREQSAEWDVIEPYRRAALLQQAHEIRRLETMNRIRAIAPAIWAGHDINELNEDQQNQVIQYTRAVDAQFAQQLENARDNRIFGATPMFYLYGDVSTFARPVQNRIIDAHLQNEEAMRNAPPADDYDGLIPPEQVETLWTRS